MMLSLLFAAQLVLAAPGTGTDLHLHLTRVNPVPTEDRDVFVTVPWSAFRCGIAPLILLGTPLPPLEMTGTLAVPDPTAPGKDCTAPFPALHLPYNSLWRVEARWLPAGAWVEAPALLRCWLQCVPTTPSGIRVAGEPPGDR